MIHELPVRIYYEDTDAGGVVYHANYLRFGERARTEYLRHIGYENSEIAKRTGVIFVVRHIDINYFKPAFLDDMLIVETTVSDLKNSSFVMNHTISLEKEDSVRGLQLAQMRVTLVCVDKASVKPVRLSDDLREAFAKYQIKQ